MFERISHYTFVLEPQTLEKRDFPLLAVNIKYYSSVTSLFGNSKYQTTRSFTGVNTLSIHLVVTPVHCNAAQLVPSYYREVPTMAASNVSKPLNNTADTPAR